MRKTGAVLMLSILMSLPALAGRQTSLWSGWFQGGDGEPITEADTISITLAAHLDDGSAATIRIREVESTQTNHLQGDDYVLELAIPGSAPVHIPIWASYGRFAVAVADLVNGAGDEVLVVSQHGRGSPLFAPVLQVWSVNRRQAVQVGECQVGGFIDTCAWWREKIVVLDGKKPRVIHLEREVEASNCPVSPELKAALPPTSRDLRWSPASSHFELVTTGSGQ